MIYNQSSYQEVPFIIHSPNYQILLNAQNPTAASFVGRHSLFTNPSILDTKRLQRGLRFLENLLAISSPIILNIFIMSPSPACPHYFYGLKYWTISSPCLYRGQALPSYQMYSTRFYYFQQSFDSLYTLSIHIEQSKHGITI